MIAPALRTRREPPAPRELVAELASLLATAYLRLCAPATAGQVREKEASAPGANAGANQQSLSPSPGEPSCDDPADRPPDRRST